MSTLDSPALATDRIERFVRHINSCQLAQLPMSLLMWRGPSFIAAVDVRLPSEIAARFDPDDAKDAQADAMAKTLRDSRATAYALFLEAWAVRPLDPRDPCAGPPPSQRADRSEVVLASYETTEGFLLARQYPVSRTATGRLHLNLSQFFETRQLTGRFSGLLRHPDISRN